MSGKLREFPDIEIKSYHIGLKPMSKLVFLPQEEVERVIMKNLCFIQESNSLGVDIAGVIDNVRDISVNNTKPKYTQIHCKMLLP